jgi:hypothetical protein
MFDMSARQRSLECLTVIPPGVGYNYYIVVDVVPEHM